MRKPIKVIICMLVVIVTVISACSAPAYKKEAGEKEAAAKNILAEYMADKKFCYEFTEATTIVALESGEENPVVTDKVHISAVLDGKKYNYYIDTTTKMIYSDFELCSIEEELAEMLCEQLGIILPDQTHFELYEFEINEYNVLRTDICSAEDMDRNYYIKASFAYTDHQIQCDMLPYRDLDLPFLCEITVYDGNPNFQIENIDNKSINAQLEINAINKSKITAVYTSFSGKGAG